LRRCEPVQGANNGGDERASTAVAGIVEDVKLTGAPPPRQLPRGIDRCTVHRRPAYNYARRQRNFTASPT
jgi:hypothetical protein